MMAPLEGSWTRRGLRGGSTGSAPKFMVQIPHRRPEGSAPAGAFRRPTGATPRLLGRRWPPYRVIVRKRRMIYTPVRGTSRTPSPTTKHYVCHNSVGDGSRLPTRSNRKTIATGNLRPRPPTHMNKQPPSGQRPRAVAVQIVSPKKASAFFS